LSVKRQRHNHHPQNRFAGIMVSCFPDFIAGAKRDPLDLDMRYDMPMEEFKPDQISQWFWQIIDSANFDRDKLKGVLKNFSAEEIARFHDEFEEAAVQLADAPFTDFMGGHLSEDSIKDVTECIVSQGKEYFTEVWHDPEKTPSYSECISMVTFSGVAGNVYAEKFGRSLHG
jgi:hypothetical protein